MDRTDQGPGGLRADAVAFGRSLLDRCDFPSSGSRVVCAVSGGADSSALALLATIAACRVEIVHVDHGLRESSAADADAVVRLGQRLGAPVTVVQVDIAPGPNLEARARDARREAVAGALLGHTADDQAETVLMNLLRGAGPVGLAGMRHDARRPLLRLRRSETIELCRLAAVVPIDDGMNVDPAFTRVRVRHEVVPLLNDVAGRDVVPLLARTAELMAGVAEGMESLGQDLDPTDARQLAGADRSAARSAVRRWLVGETGSVQPYDLADVDRVLDVAAGAVRATEVAGGWRVSRHQQRLRISRPSVGRR